ncbi:hypothetical protein BGY98DRAFT_1039603 [Russula aff. rugulosa BPL654]|nr:hypothetical protein BGY98DRAFT_1039603 [Russula aff. rugulosa BPL654]
MPIRLTAFVLFKLSEKEGDNVLAARYQLFTTSPELLGYGHGQHACRKRSQIVLARILILIPYDFKFEKGKEYLLRTMSGGDGSNGDDWVWWRNKFIRII